MTGARTAIFVGVLWLSLELVAFVAGAGKATDDSVSPPSTSPRPAAVSGPCVARAQVVHRGHRSRPLPVRRAQRRHARLVNRIAGNVRWAHPRRAGISVACYIAGGASWYDAEGAPGACGYGLDGLYAAHRTLPCGTRLIVWHGGRSVRVRVEDRGPYIDGRVLDLSEEAFRRLADPSAGVIDVEARRA